MKILILVSSYLLYLLHEAHVDVCNFATNINGTLPRGKPPPARVGNPTHSAPRQGATQRTRGLHRPHPVFELTYLTHSTSFRQTHSPAERKAPACGGTGAHRCDGPAHTTRAGGIIARAGHLRHTRPIDPAQPDRTNKQLDTCGCGTCTPHTGTAPGRRRAAANTPPTPHSSARRWWRRRRPRRPAASWTRPGATAVLTRRRRRR